jgi:hypothetical protein
MKRVFLLGASLLVVAAFAAAAVRARYRIDFKNGSSLFSRDLPVLRGSVLLFHPYPAGALTSVPEEQVRGVVTGVAESSGSHALRPGDVVFLGPTGGGQTVTAAAPQPAPVTDSMSLMSGSVYDPRNPLYGGYSSPSPRLPNGQPMPQGEIPRAQTAPLPGSEMQVAPNGYPSTTGRPPVAQNGTPKM